ncbi:MAG: hypothetical protein KJN92_02210, partial [Gemmatimonadetes bacterium]|nr:hypothetical protein [Gemmatimonadota bacterium]
RATSNILFSGDNRVIGGDGGAGGDAWALGKENSDPLRAPGATAKGGRGGDPGTPAIIAVGDIVIGPAALTLGVGAIGDGGYAIALGADGMDAADRDGGAQKGGEARAEGGHGGLALSKYFRARGSVSGAETVAVESPHSGHGGAAYADGGKGGDGDKEDVDGAQGGDMEATGGGGAKNDVNDQDGNRIQKGGDGGAAIFGAYPAPPTGASRISVPADRQGRGLGGAGFDGCSVVPFRIGGQGGPGGGVAGADGEGGPGKEQGQPGSVQFHGVSNAGDGDDGIPHGDGGTAGPDGVSATGQTIIVEDSFMDGEDGADCPIPPKYSPLHHIGGILSSDPWVLARHLMPAPWTGDFFHSRTDIPAIPRAMDHTTVKELGATVVNIDAAGASLLDFYFACGTTGEAAFVRCNTEGDLAPGEYVAVSILLHGEVPTNDSKTYQYAVVFDQDDDESNNFMAREPFGRDGLDNADRLYDVIHGPGFGWVARSAFYDPPTDGVYAYDSNSRFIIDGNTIVLLIPRSEFGTDFPKVRVTTFCHEGDFGLEGGPFSGDHQGPVGSQMWQVKPNMGS